METKTHKFLLCDNPVKKEGFDLYILSTRQGKRALIKVFKFSILDYFGKRGIPPNDFYTVYFQPTAGNYPDHEQYELRVFNNYDMPEEKFASVLKEAGKWFKNYLIWEDKKIKDYEDKSRKTWTNLQFANKMFHPKLRTLFVFHSNEFDAYLAQYKGKIHKFKTEEGLYAWMREDLNLAGYIINDGYINEV